MDKMKEFFNKKALTWDDESKADKNKIEKILKVSELEKNSKILDIACGTGVLEEFLLEFNPKSILAIDIAENMIMKAKEKYSDKRITFKNEDLFNIKNEKFDYVIIYNAFPHFLEPEKMIGHVYDILDEKGKFVICHGMGRRDLNGHHKRVASEISLGLKPANENVELLKNYFEIKEVIDEKEIYIIYGRKK